LLSILTSCHTPSAPSPELAEPAAHYVKASSKRFSMPASPVKKRNSRLKRKSVVIGTPSGFRHEFHLGRDVNSMSELWDLERWREEIENRVQVAAAEHAAINAAAAAQEEETAPTKRPRPQSMIKRKPVPSLDPNEPSASSEPVPPMPTITLPDSNEAMSRLSTESSSVENDYSSSSCHGSEEAEDTCSVMSSLPPPTPPSQSPRASTDLKYVDVAAVQQLAPVVEMDPRPISEVLPDDDIFGPPIALLPSNKSATMIQYGEELSTTDGFDGVHDPPLHGDIAVAS